MTDATPSGSGTQPSGAKYSSLASTAVQDHQVLPFINVDCAAITRLLAPSLSSEPPARRDLLYGRALARVLAHEFYHVLGRTVEHGESGISKTVVRASDLLGNRMEFEEAAIVKVRPPAPVQSSFDDIYYGDSGGGGGR
jgi:hypothetical protein